MGDYWRKRKPQRERRVSKAIGGYTISGLSCQAAFYGGTGAQSRTPAVIHIIIVGRAIGKRTIVGVICLDHIVAHFAARNFWNFRQTFWNG